MAILPLRLSQRSEVARFLWIVLPLMGLSRLLAWGVWDVAPDPGHFVGHWQHLPLSEMMADYWGSLWRMHAQPPLWNGLLGAVGIACGGSEACVVRAVHGAHVALTLAMAVGLYGLTRGVSDAPLLPAIVAGSFAASWPVLFYESYVFYPHLTATLFVAFAWSALLAITTGRTVPFVGAALALALLSWIWTLFHPVYVAVVLATLLVAARAVRPVPVAASVLAVAFALLPAAKNQINYGVFSGGTWLGLNISQTIPGAPERCNFDAYLGGLQTGGVPDRVLLHDDRVIAYAQDCQRMALARLRDVPGQYVLGRLDRMRDTFGQWPHDYGFRPLNWHRVPAPLILRDYSRPPPRVEISRNVTRAVTLVLTLAALIWPVHQALRSPDPTTRRFFAVMAVAILLFLLIAYAANGIEQDRMRYTVHPVLWLCLGLMTHRWLTRRRR